MNKSKTQAQKSTGLKALNKYELYEASVQDAADDASILADLYKRIRKKKAHSLREDFCGTHMVACEWVRLDPKNTAIGLDIDPEPLAYGQKTHYAKLNPEQQKRMKAMKKNVLSVTKPKVDIVSAANFSYWIFKTRKELVAYFKKAKDSLKDDGLFFLDCVGGTEMIEEHEDHTDFGRAKNRFTYIWRQESYNPITSEGFFSISFKMRDGREMKRAFTYDWRVWSIQEIRECLQEAGFKTSHVYWEDDDEDGDGNGEFFKTDKQDQCEVWICYIVASKQ